jgi:membrane associated rhomboid family serine protease
VATETCYRHSDRETGVSCSNCGRPICPDCMTPTPVGMRCPECSRERTKVTTGTASFGRSNAAPATYTLMVLNVVAFLLQILSGVGGLSGIGEIGFDFGLVPALVADGEVYRVVTSAFLHAGPLHLAFNMFALYILGTLLEPVIGTARFVAIYVASLLAGALGVVVLEPDSLGVTVGASGAVFGLFAAAFVIARGRGMQEISSQLGFLIVINLAFTFGIPGISIGGHLGGLVGGAVCALVVLAGDRGSLPGRRRVPAEVAAILVIGALCGAAAVMLAELPTGPFA